MDKTVITDEARTKPKHDGRRMAADKKRIYDIFILYICKRNTGRNERTGAARVERITKYIKGKAGQQPRRTGRKEKGMGTWKNYIEELKKKWIGQKVIFENVSYNVVDVDMNGLLLIDKKTYYCESYTSKTTAIETWKVENGVYKN